MTYSDPNDPLLPLLRSADAGSPPPPAPPGLAEKVRARAKRQRRRAAIAAVACVSLLSAIGSALLVRPPAREGLEVATSRDLEAEARQAALEAEVRLAVARRISAAERRRSTAASLSRALAAAAPTWAEHVAAQREQAALTLLDQADRFHARAGSSADALATYRRAVALFPDTESADVARQRIVQAESRPKT